MSNRAVRNSIRRLCSTVLIAVLLLSGFNLSLEKQGMTASADTADIHALDIRKHYDSTLSGAVNKFTVRTSTNAVVDLTNVFYTIQVLHEDGITAPSAYTGSSTTELQNGII